MNAPTKTTIELERSALVDEQLGEVFCRMQAPKHPNTPPTRTDTLMILPNYNVQERQADELRAIRDELHEGRLQQQELNGVLRELVGAVKALAVALA